MAKLIAVCVVAAWLTAALAGGRTIGALNNQLRRFNSIFRLDTIENKKDKTVEDWNTLEEGYSRILLHKFIKLNADKVYNLLEKLEEALEHSKKQKRDFLHPVGHYLAFRRDMNCARETSIEDRANSLCVFKTNWSMRNYVTDSISKYLEHCKYEEMFKHAISQVDRDGIKHWDWIKYPTLYDYWKENVRPQEIRYVQTESNWILRLVRNISSLRESIDCPDKDLRNSLIENVINSKLYHPELYTLVDAYFKKYLSVCGLEHRFKTAKAVCGLETEGGDSAFHHYLMGELWEQTDKNGGKLEDEMQSTISIVGNLLARSQIDVSYCSENNKMNLNSDLLHIRAAKYTKLSFCWYRSWDRLWRVCQEDFANKVEAFKYSHETFWSRIEQFKAAMEKSGDVSTLNDKIRAVNSFKSHQKEVAQNQHGLEVTDLQQACDLFFKTVISSEKAIDLQIIWDNRILEFHDAFEYCAILLGEMNAKK